MDKKYNVLLNNAKTKVNGITIKTEQLAKEIEDFVIAQMKAHDKVYINPGKCKRFSFWNKTHFSLCGIRYDKDMITLSFQYMYHSDIDCDCLKIINLPYIEQYNFLNWFINEVVIPDNFTNYC